MICSWEVPNIPPATEVKPFASSAEYDHKKKKVKNNGYEFSKDKFIAPSFSNFIFASFFISSKSVEGDSGIILTMIAAIPIYRNRKSGL